MHLHFVSWKGSKARFVSTNEVDKGELGLHTMVPGLGNGFQTVLNATEWMQSDRNTEAANRVSIVTEVNWLESNLYAGSTCQRLEKLVFAIRPDKHNKSQFQRPNVFNFYVSEVRIFK
jgi:hypothetical protein